MKCQLKIIQENVLTMEADVCNRLCMVPISLTLTPQNGTKNMIKIILVSIHAKKNVKKEDKEEKIKQEVKNQEKIK